MGSGKCIWIRCTGERFHHVCYIINIFVDQQLTIMLDFLLLASACEAWLPTLSLPWLGHPNNHGRIWEMARSSTRTFALWTSTQQNTNELLLHLDNIVRFDIIIEIHSNPIQSKPRHRIIPVKLLDAIFGRLRFVLAKRSKPKSAGIAKTRKVSLQPEVRSHRFVSG